MPYLGDNEAPRNEGWIPGVDFDPHDPDEMEVMHLVWDQEKYDRTRQLERENELLRAALNSQMTEAQRDEVDAATDAGASYAQAVCNIWNANKAL